MCCSDGTYLNNISVTLLMAPPETHYFNERDFNPNNILQLGQFLLHLTCKKETQVRVLVVIM